MELAHCDCARPRSSGSPSRRRRRTAISSISSKLTRVELAGGRDDARVGREDAAHVRVDLAVRRRRARPRARPRSCRSRRGRASSPRRRSRRPGSRRRARSSPASSASWIRRARTSTIFALPCTVSVTMPACEPVSEIASWPRSWIAIAASAHEIRSPTETSMSSSRGCGVAETWRASSSSSSVVWPIAERTPTTRWPSSRAATSRAATRFSFSASATEVPPNLSTSVPSRPPARRRRRPERPRIRSQPCRRV